MKVSDIRRTFLKFYESKGHTIVASSPVVPGNAHNRHHDYRRDDDREALALPIKLLLLRSRGSGCLRRLLLLFSIVVYSSPDYLAESAGLSPQYFSRM